MKRFHVHVCVRDLDESVRFYSHLFAEKLSVREAEYAKWMLDDPRVNFAISTRSGAPGIDHLGIQAETAEELAELGVRLDATGQAVVPEAGAECCHARSDKFWTQDPQGMRWESFHTVGRIATYHGAGGACEMSSARAADLNALAAGEPARTRSAQTQAAQTRATQADAMLCCEQTTAQGICCAPKPERAADAPCCGPVVAAAKRAGCALSGCQTERSRDD